MADVDVIGFSRSVETAFSASAEQRDAFLASIAEDMRDEFGGDQGPTLYRIILGEADRIQVPLTDIYDRFAPIIGRDRIPLPPPEPLFQPPSDFSNEASDTSRNVDLVMAISNALDKPEAERKGAIAKAAAPFHDVLKGPTGVGCFFGLCHMAANYPGTDKQVREVLTPIVGQGRIFKFEDEARAAFYVMRDDKLCSQSMETYLARHLPRILIEMRPSPGADMYASLAAVLDRWQQLVEAKASRDAKSNFLKSIVVTLPRSFWPSPEAQQFGQRLIDIVVQAKGIKKDDKAGSDEDINEIISAIVQRANDAFFRELNAKHTPSPSIPGAKILALGVGMFHQWRKKRVAKP